MMKRIRLLAVVLGFFAAALAESLFGESLPVREERLGPVPDGVLNQCTLLSKDGCHVAMVVRRGGKEFVVVDGQPGPIYDDIRDHMFSPDCKRVAYKAKNGGKWLVVVDGQPGPEYDEIWTKPIFSPDSSRMAYWAKKGGKGFVVVDGQQGPAYSSIHKGPIFSPDSKRVAYWAKKGEKWLLVVDGQPGPEFDHIGNEPIVTVTFAVMPISHSPVIFSPNSRRVA